MAEQKLVQPFRRLVTSWNREQPKAGGAAWEVQQTTLEAKHRFDKMLLHFIYKEIDS